MGDINLSQTEKDALKSIDPRQLDASIDRALDGGPLGELHCLRLHDCGFYVANKLREFEDAVRQYRDAKSSRKVADAHDRAQRAGHRLSHAFGAMKQRMEEEEQEGELFRIEDHIFPPFRFYAEMDVRVSYRWRKSVADDWAFGSITFTHVYRHQPAYWEPTPKRKPSAAKQAAALQDKMAGTWEHLRLTALCTVRDYFREGGDGNRIPETFRALPDSQGHLNNFSARFWQGKPSD